MNLLNTYLKAKGWRSSGNSHEPLLPYIMSDAVYIIHNEYIPAIHLTQEAKMYSNRMMKNYNHMNHQFFKIFSPAEQEQIVDIMDSFSEYIHNEVEILRMTVMQRMEKYPTAIRMNSSVLVALVHLSECAKITWHNIYGKIPNKELDAIAYNAQRLLQAYGDRYVSDTLNLNSCPEVVQASINLINKIKKFIEEKWE